MCSRETLQLYHNPLLAVKAVLLRKPQLDGFLSASLQVSKKALWLLSHIEQEPLLNLEQLNPELVEHAEAMGQAHVQRQKLCLLGDYLRTCRSGACKNLQARSVLTVSRLL